MKINVPNEMLLGFDTELNQLRSSVLYFLLNGKINKFYQDNGIRIETLKTKRNEMMGEFLVIENGQVKTEGEGDKKKIVYKDPLREKEFQDKIKELMEKQNTIEV